MGTLVKSFAIIMIVELFLVFQYLVLVGALADEPLQAVVDICESAGTNPYDLGVAIFIIGTMFNVAVFVPLIIILGRGGPWG